jgi:tetratricopeptide (TPR) repeat protein
MLSPLPYGIPPPVTLPFVDKLVSLIRKRGVILTLCMVTAGSLAGYYVVQRVTQLDPIFYGPDAKSLKALALYEIGAYSRAAEQYRKDYADYLQNQQDVPQELLTFLRRDNEGAIKWAQHELTGNPNSIEAMLALARVAYDQKEYAKAADYTRRILTLYWDNTDALLLAAFIATWDPSQGDPFRYLNMALRTGTAARNLPSFLHVLEIVSQLQSQPRSERQYGLLMVYHRILMIHDTGMANRVMAIARRAITKGDHPAEAFYGMGVIFEKTGRPHKALEAYQEAVRADPNHASAYYATARLYMNRQDDLHHYLFLKEAAKASPADPLHFSALYHRLAHKQEWYASTRFMQTVIETAPANLTAHVHLAWALESMGEPGRSQQVLHQILGLEARSPKELESKSWAARRVGEEGQGEALLQKSILLDRGRPEPHRELAKFYKDKGRIAEARQEFEITAQLGGYDNPNEWLGYCALYGNEQPPSICTQDKAELARGYRTVIQVSEP